MRKGGKTKIAIYEKSATALLPKEHLILEHLCFNNASPKCISCNIEASWFFSKITCLKAVLHQFVRTAPILNDFLIRKVARLSLPWIVITMKAIRQLISKDGL